MMLDTLHLRDVIVPPVRMMAIEVTSINAGGVWKTGIDVIIIREAGCL